MDTLTAFAMGALHQHDRIRTFDWDRAAQRIREADPKYADAGLQDDWSYTADTIYADGLIPEQGDFSTLYLSSTWATPLLELDGVAEPCWVWADEADGWDAHTYWPASARAILAAETT